MITAVKPIWTGKEFKVDVVRDVHSLGSYAGAGFLVYDDPVRILKDVKEGRMVPNWGDRKRAAIINFLEAEVGNQAMV